MMQLSLSWMKNATGVAARLMSADIREELGKRYNRYRSMCEDGSWKVDFSGKEIFEAVFYAHRRGSGTILDVYKRASEYVAQRTIQFPDLEALFLKLKELGS